jgi:hypothetical protein
MPDETTTTTTTTSTASVVDLAGLAYFYTQLRSKFYPRALADGTFAAINGSASEEFSAAGMKMYSGVNHVDIAFDPTNNAVVITNGVYSTVIPVNTTSQTLLTNATTYAPAFTDNGVTYLKAAVPQVFDRLSALGAGVDFSDSAVCEAVGPSHVGTLVAVRKRVSGATSRIYVVTAVSGTTATAVQYLGVPTPSTLYYNRGDSKFYVFTVGTGFEPISTEYEHVVSGEDDLPVATDQEIAAMLDEIDALT